MSSGYILSDNGVSSGSAGLKTGGGNDGTLQLQTTTSSGTATTAVTVDNNQNVGVGTTSWSTSRLYVLGNSTNYGITSEAPSGYGSFTFKQTGGNSWALGMSSNALFFYNGTAGSESMRIDTSGNLLVGTTTNAGRTTIYGATSDSSTYALRVRSASGTDGLIVRSEPYVGIPNNYTITTASAANMYFGADGFIYRSTSSARYKKDIQDYDKGVSDVLKLRSVYYKSDRPDVDGNKSETQFAGLIAEEVDAVGLKEFVVYNKENQPDALHYGNMVALCIKAIQEQQALITSLTERITALEGAKA